MIITIIKIYFTTYRIVVNDIVMNSKGITFANLWILYINIPLHNILEFFDSPKGKRNLTPSKRSSSKSFSRIA